MPWPTFEGMSKVNQTLTGRPAGGMTLVRKDKVDLNAPRFSPTEIEELIKSGELTSDDIAKMHPEDRAVANHLNMQSASDVIFGGMGAGKALSAGAGMLKEGLPAVASKVGHAAVGVAKGAAGMAGYTAGALALKKLGVPSEIINAVMLGSAFSKMGGGGKAAAGEVSAADAALEQEAFRRQSALRADKLAPRLRQPAMQPGSTVASTNPIPNGAPVNGPASVPSAPRGSNVSHVAPDRNDIVSRVVEGGVGAERRLGTADVREQVQRGVQNDFRGGVSIERPGPVTRQAPSADELASSMPGTKRRSVAPPATPQTDSLTGMPFGVKADYNGWVDSQDSKAKKGSIDDLIRQFEATLKRNKP